ncbi:MAG TPA: VWA domain-containing protein [Bacteroidia bacterium]|nr:VWA domain-containing protein [Bacteroidia bacterium]
MLTIGWKKRMMARFGETGLVSKLMPEISRAKRIFRFVISMLAVTMVILTVLNLQAGSRLREVKRKGSRIIIALDVSNSMKAEDLQPNRLERAKQAISKLIDNLQGDELGLVVFAGKAYVQLPITTDYDAAKLFLDNIDTDVVPTQGTSISDAIVTAEDAFGNDEEKNKALIIITDGEDHEGNVSEMAAQAYQKGIVIHTIGLGSANGVPIPLAQGKNLTGFRKDKNGATIITRLDEKTLEEVARAGHGLYIHASNADVGLNRLLEEISGMNKSDIDTHIYDDYDDYFYWFAGAALVLLILETLVSERKSKLYRRLNLFGEHPDAGQEQN